MSACPNIWISPFLLNNEFSVNAFNGLLPLYFLFTATSALDNTTEREVQAAIESHFADATVIMIAHRLSTVVNCDIIFVLGRGGVLPK